MDRIAEAVSSDVSVATGLPEGSNHVTVIFPLMPSGTEASQTGLKGWPIMGG